MKKTYEVKILNQKFKLKSDNDARYVERVSDFVNEKLFEIKEKTHSVSSLNVALLAALNIADDYFKIKEEKAGQNKQAKTKLNQLIKLIDQQLKES